MPKIKGTDIVTLKKYFAKQGKETEEAFLSRLSEDDRKVFLKTVATNWTDVTIQARIYDAAGDTLFPGQADAQEKLGHLLADQAYSGVYSIFLLIPKTSYIFKKTASVWGSYHDTGTASLENVQPDNGDLVVTGYPDLPPQIRQGIKGHVSVLLTKTGAKDIRITLDESNPEKWVWHVEWS